MRTPTLEQKAVLESAARVRLVQAAPGSGKTWMVAEAIRKELAAWNSPHSGIAALSFTRVGGDEIRSALGRELGHPHFVGTIDSFLFRHVVRPHIRAYDHEAKTPQLIPPDWQPADIWKTHIVGPGINPFDCHWVGRDSGGEPILARRLKSGEVETVVGDDRHEVVKFKRMERQRRGRITISDSALLASTILTRVGSSDAIVSEVVRRFPLIIVDELQDTGELLGESISALTRHPDSRALLVGDPDQAIYEFSGARPSMFQSFGQLAGVKSLGLSSSDRCPAAVVRAAEFVKCSPGPLLPSAVRTGRAILVRYRNMVEDVGKVARHMARVAPGGIVKVVTRSNSTVMEIFGVKGTEVPSLHCRPATLMHRAIQHFRRGKSIPALAAARSAMEQVLVRTEGLSDDELRAKGVEPETLRRLAIEALIEADGLPRTGSVIDWQTAAFEIVERLAAAHKITAKIPACASHKSPSRYARHDEPVAKSITDRATEVEERNTVPVLTVHGVKGETHDVTIFLVPPANSARKRQRCPSVVWWTGGAEADEERRIAYVAMTRSRLDLILCVDEQCYQRLLSRRPNFVDVFEELNVEELEQLGTFASSPGLDYAEDAVI